MLLKFAGRDKGPGHQALSLGRGHKGLLVIGVEDLGRRQARLADQGLEDACLGLTAAHLVGQDERPKRFEQTGIAFPDVLEVELIGIG